MTEPKHDLLVFNKREIIVILVLLFLVALTSFTIGLKIGKQLGGGIAPVSEEHGHETEHNVATHHEEGSKENEYSSSHNGGHGAEPTHGEKPATETHGADPHAAPLKKVAALKEKPFNAEAEQKENEKKPSVKGEALSVADSALNEEMAHEKIRPLKSVQTALPTQKKSGGVSSSHTTETSAETAGGFTLQVGAYKTEHEAIERVETLKKHGIENVFFFVAEVPGKGKWYRVGIGTYNNKSSAEDAGKNLKAKFSDGSVTSYIIQRTKE